MGEAHLEESRDFEVRSAEGGSKKRVEVGLEAGQFLKKSYLPVNQTSHFKFTDGQLLCYFLLY